MTALKDALDALRPFAVLADKWKQAQDGKLNLPDDWLVAIAPSDALTIGDLRRAAAAVEAIDKMQEAPPPPVGDMVLVPREVMEAKRTRYSDRLSPRILESVGKDIEEWRDLALEAVNDIHALLATAAPLPAQEVTDAGWQSMETWDYAASPTGTAIVCRGDDDVGEAIFDEPYPDSTPPTSGGWRWIGHDEYMDPQPRAWQPLPAPPESALRTGEKP